MCGLVRWRTPRRRRRRRPSYCARRSTRSMARPHRLKSRALTGCGEGVSGWRSKPHPPPKLNNRSVIIIRGRPRKPNNTCWAGDHPHRPTQTHDGVRGIWHHVSSPKMCLPRAPRFSLGWCVHTAVEGRRHDLAHDSLSSCVRYVEGSSVAGGTAPTTHTTRVRLLRSPACCAALLVAERVALPLLPLLYGGGG